ncbi:tRNA (adenosine(37)-N6)-threonylcarbamoyltransferase complex transferase subunit TsaD, partial [Candidatus Microgenomates bacterium]|nr:tRNA (adenosine(37)-N6)-threonylcarbamoyltransferase complex transferase subunit TsaD [Candidatus Microgenomates bacterium]
PYLGVLLSGVHSEFVLWNDHLSYEVIGETVDDAAGEALDKAARLLFSIGYPGGGFMERIAAEVGNVDEYKFTRPMLRSGDLNLSFSGLKTSLLYLHRSMSEAERVNRVKYMASSFQEAVFDTILRKLSKAIDQTGVNRLAVGGGVIANQYLRKKLRALARKHGGEAVFPPYKYLTGDNAGMIGVVAAYRAEKNQFVTDLATLDRLPRMHL